MKKHNEFFEQWDDDFRKIAEKKQKALDEKRKSFLKTVNNVKDWKMRLSLSASEIYVMARVLCRSLSL